jgi:hypothetical protein
MQSEPTQLQPERHARHSESKRHGHRAHSRHAQAKKLAERLIVSAFIVLVVLTALYVWMASLRD